jgi:hypothetical protein
MRNPGPAHGYLVGIGQVGTMPDQEAREESFSGTITIQQAKNPTSYSVAHCHQRGRATGEDFGILRL